MKPLTWVASLWLALAFQFAIAETKSDLQPNQEQELVNLPALTYLQKMQQAYKQLNYELLYINTDLLPIEPQKILHGVEDEKQISRLSFLNGPKRESLHFNDKISYYEDGVFLYSLVTKKDQSVFATVANIDLLNSDENYHYQILSRGRIADRDAIAIRLINKDKYRYGYVVWLDEVTYLPLRLDTISHESEIIEQVMVLSLSVSEKIDSKLLELSARYIPEMVERQPQQSQSAVPWKINWLPAGFKVIKGDQHKLILHDTDPVSYIMLSDGMVIVSVYIAAKSAIVEEQKNVIERASTLLYTLQQGNIEVTIIGKIPLITAEKIAASIKAVE